MRTLFEQEAVAAAEEYGLRERTIPLAKLLYVLVLGCWQQPSAGPSALARFAGSLGLDVCKQDLDSHFTERTALWLLAVLRRAVQLLVCAKPVELALFRQFKHVWLEDGSTISLPAILKTVWQGCGGNRPTKTKDAKTEAALKITVRWDVLGGRLDGPHLQPGKQHEWRSVLQEHHMPAGSLWIADARRLETAVAVQSRQAGRLLSAALQTGHRALVQQAAARSAGRSPEASRPAPGTAGRCGSHQTSQRGAPARLGAGLPRWPSCGKSALGSRHACIRKCSIPSCWNWRDFPLILTNVPAAMLSHEQAAALLRARWQVELLFKLWKQSALLDEWTGTKPWRVLCEVEALLLAMVVQHWFLLHTSWDDPHHSLPAVAELLRDQVPTLVHGLCRRLPLRKAVALLLSCVRGGCSIPARRSRPSTSRLLQSTPGFG